MAVPVSRIATACGDEIAYCYSEGRSPAVVFLSGFRSDMSGTKARYLETWCLAREQAFLRLDYRGHGVSGGHFERLGVSDWLDDVRRVLDAASIQAPVVVGSSMGAWIGLLLARSSEPPLYGLVTLAGAPDFTQRLLWPRLETAQREAVMRDGVTYVPSRYGDGPYPITRRLIEDGEQHLLLTQPLELRCPLRIMHGTSDPDVPYTHGLRLFEHVAAPEVTLTLLKGGDHRLSDPDALREITLAIDALLTKY